MRLSIMLDLEKNGFSGMMPKAASPKLRTWGTKSRFDKISRKNSPSKYCGILYF